MVACDLSCSWAGPIACVVRKFGSEIGEGCERMKNTAQGVGIGIKNEQESNMSDFEERYQAAVAAVPTSTIADALRILA